MIKIYTEEEKIVTTDMTMWIKREIYPLRFTHARRALRQAMDLGES